MLYIENGNCVNVCSGNLIPINNICTACSSACTTCVNTINNCVVCAVGYYYTTTNIPNCINNCNSGYIYHNITNY